MVLYLLVATPAFAQGYFNADTAPAADSNAAAPDEAAPPSHTVVVTSIEKCYAQLGHADALDIEQHYLKPYEECQRRLALKLQQQHEVKPGQQKKAITSQSPIGQMPPPSAPTPAAPPPPAAQNPAPVPGPPGPPDNFGGAPASNTPVAPLSDEGLYYRVQKNALPAPAPAATDDNNTKAQ